MRNALTTAKTYYTNNNSYGSTASIDVAAFSTLEPSLAFVAAQSSTALVNANIVGVVADADAAPETGVCLVGLSKTGTYFAIMDTSDAGTYYFKGSAAPTGCTSGTGGVFSYTTATAAGW